MAKIYISFLSLWFCRGNIGETTVKIGKTGVNIGKTEVNISKTKREFQDIGKTKEIYFFQGTLVLPSLKIEVNSCFTNLN